MVEQLEQLSERLQRTRWLERLAAGWVERRLGRPSGLGLWLGRPFTTGYPNSRNRIRKMTLKIAKRFILVMCSLSVGIAILYTFINQDYIGAMVGISSASVFYFLYRNPEMLMAKNWDEFGELADNSRDQKYVWGFPAYHAVMLSAILYIWLG
jgi:F0F1-type ATP synthase membrane subunit c/vacuolar-type H+-ATPase subunit K